LIKVVAGDLILILNDEGGPETATTPLTIRCFLEGRELLRPEVTITRLTISKPSRFFVRVVTTSDQVAGFNIAASNLTVVAEFCAGICYADLFGGVSL
jgi:hypothetical protein